MPIRVVHRSSSGSELQDANLDWPNHVRETPGYRVEPEERGDTVSVSDRGCWFESGFKSSNGLIVVSKIDVELNVAVNLRAWFALVSPTVDRT